MAKSSAAIQHAEAPPASCPQAPGSQRSEKGEAGAPSTTTLTMNDINMNKVKMKKKKTKTFDSLAIRLPCVPQTDSLECRIFKNSVVVLVVFFFSLFFFYSSMLSCKELAYTSGELRRNSVSSCSLCTLAVLTSYLLAKHGTWLTGYLLSG